MVAKYNEDTDAHTMDFNDRDGEYLYLKKDGKFHRVERFTGFPSEGVWIVMKTKGSSRQKFLYPLLKLKKLMDFPKRFWINRISLEFCRDAVAKAILDLQDRQRGYSVEDILDTVFNAIAEDSLAETDILKELENPDKNEEDKIPETSQLETTEITSF